MDNLWAGEWRRREIMALFAAAVVDLPVIAYAQKLDRARRIGVIMNLPVDHPDGPARIAAFRQELRKYGWTDGENLKTEYRWAGSDRALYRQYAIELAALVPDVIVGAGSGWIAAELQRVTHNIPIVLAGTSDPVVDGYVEILARPGGNVTGFSRIGFDFSIKWLELLHEIAPGVKRAGVLQDTKYNGKRQLAAIEAAASSQELEITSVSTADPDEIERDIAAFAREPNGGLVVTAGTQATVNSQLIIDLAAKYRLPAVYPNADHVERGGLISYGPSCLSG